MLPPEAGDIIRHAYQTEVGLNGRAAVAKSLATRFGVPRWKISRVAREMGLVARQKKEPDWSEKECEILRRTAHLSLSVIQRHLARAGFRRSETGIEIKRKRMRFLVSKDGYSAHQIAQCFGIDVKSVTRWIHLGYLRAQKRGTARTARQGGDIHFIRDRWVRDFVLEYLPLIDIRKVDKYWFVDLLAGGVNGMGALSTPKEDSSGETYPDDYTLHAQCGL